MFTMDHILSTLVLDTVVFSTGATTIVPAETFSRGPCTDDMKP